MLCAAYPHAVEPAHGCTVARVPERLEFVVPRGPEREVHRALEVGGIPPASSAARMRSSGTTMLPTTSVTAWKMPSPGVWRPAPAVAAVGSVLGHLVANVLPPAQGGREARAGSLDPLPRAPRIGTRLGPAGCSVQSKVPREPSTLPHSPLDVRAHGTSGRVHKKHTAGDGSHDPSFLSRFVFPNDLNRNGEAGTQCVCLLWCLTAANYASVIRSGCVAGHTLIGARTIDSRPGRPTIEM